MGLVCVTVGLCDGKEVGGTDGSTVGRVAGEALELASKQLSSLTPGGILQE